MSYRATIEFRETYLHVNVIGNNTLENVLAYLNEVHAACLKYQCSNVMIEENLTGPALDTFEVFEVVMKNFNKALLIKLRLAYVDLNTEHDKRGVKFAENLAHIRGVNVELFYDTQTALRRLLNSKKNRRTMSDTPPPQAVLTIEAGESIAEAWITPQIPGIGFYKLLAKKRKDGTCEWVHFVQRLNGEKDAFSRGEVTHEQELETVLEAINSVLARVVGQSCALKPGNPETYSLTGQQLRNNAVH